MMRQRAYMYNLRGSMSSISKMSDEKENSCNAVFLKKTYDFSTSHYERTHSPTR